MSNEEAIEIKRYARYLSEMNRIMDMEKDTARRVLCNLVGELYCALADHDAVPEGLHPSDVLSKHIQRGNINKDGEW